MKAKLEFDLDEPHDREQHDMCLKAPSMYSALFDIDCYLRSQRKYGDPPEDSPLFDIVDKFYEVLEAHDIQI